MSASTSSNRHSFKLDPRHYQLAVQAGLLGWGALGGYFEVVASTVLLVVAAALLVQWGWTFWLKLPLNPLSTLNTSLSVLLLLNAQHAGWLVLAVLLGISSKFCLRLQGRHVFNPSNFGLVVVLLLSDAVWVAHGKWGQGIWLGLLLAGSGLIVLLGWRRMLTSLAFLLAYTLLLLGRAWWLGDPWSIPLHQLQNGALLIFTFFMLSDPMTTPAASIGRVLYGAWVALLAALLQFYGFIPNAFLYALAASSPLVLLINYQLTGEPYRWLTRRLL
ncbi:MAG: RnfABCDGE type electron transport complex subunit D [Thiolinea sp.]